MSKDLVDIADAVDKNIEEMKAEFRRGNQGGYCLQQVLLSICALSAWSQSGPS